MKGDKNLQFEKIMLAAVSKIGGEGKKPARRHDGNLEHRSGMRNG